MEGAFPDLHFGIMSTFVNVKIVRFAVIVNKDRNNLNLKRGWFCIFSCSLQYKVTVKSQRSKTFNSQISYQKKCVCSVVLAG